MVPARLPRSGELHDRLVRIRSSRRASQVLRGKAVDEAGSLSYSMQITKLFLRESLDNSNLYIYIPKPVVAVRELRFHCLLGGVMIRDKTLAGQLLRGIAGGRAALCCAAGAGADPGRST